MICKLFLISLSIEFGLSNASPVPQDSIVISQHDVRNADGYDWGYEFLSNGQRHSEIAGNEGDSAVVKDFYSFDGTDETDGFTHTVAYTSDENGYKPIISTSNGGVSNIEMTQQMPPLPVPIPSAALTSLIGG